VVALIRTVAHRQVSKLVPMDRRSPAVAAPRRSSPFMQTTEARHRECQAGSDMQPCDRCSQHMIESAVVDR
jgi:hypothetical protein